MRNTLFSLLLALLSPLAWADAQQDLYQLAGWPQQRDHFIATLEFAQQKYRDQLPPQLHQMLTRESGRRFTAEAIDQRALQQLRQQLPDAQPALAFFGSETGQRVVQAEVNASSPDQLKRYSMGIPQITASAERRQLIQRLANAIPAEQAALEVSMALSGAATSSAAKSLEQLSGIPGLSGLLNNPSTQQLLDNQRQGLVERIRPQIPDTLLYVYRDLSDEDLVRFNDFAESADGQTYYQAVLAMLKSALAEG